VDGGGSLFWALKTSRVFRLWLCSTRFQVQPETQTCSQSVLISADLSGADACGLGWDLGDASVCRFRPASKQTLRPATERIPAKMISEV
jgi:hypothetical protein